jgi:phosphoribosylanthranilate isomerase
LPSDVTPVGLFVDAPLDDVRRTADFCGIRTVQLHGQEPPEYCQNVGLEVIKAIRVKGAESLSVLNDYEVKAFLLDSYSADTHGGTGKTFDHDLVAQAKASGHLIVVAGGLTPETVASVVQRTKPYGVDVASGVESAPGIKDPPKVRAFIERAKATDVEMIHET